MYISFRSSGGSARNDFIVGSSLLVKLWDVLTHDMKIMNLHKKPIMVGPIL